MRTIYFWMISQILVGIWMFISPSIFRYRELMGAATNSMIFGAIVVLLGFGVALYEFYHREEAMHGMEHAKERAS
jgi:hypothetical protein